MYLLKRWEKERFSSFWRMALRLGALIQTSYLALGGFLDSLIAGMQQEASTSEL